MSLMIGNSIRTLRIGKNMTQEKLAEQMGVSVQAVSKWEIGLSYPDITLLPELADFFEVSLDYLMCQKKTEGKENPMAFVQKQPLDWDFLKELGDDDIRRIIVLQFRGKKLLKQDSYPEEESIVIQSCDAMQQADASKTIVNIWGNAEITGGITGSVNVGSDIRCGAVTGPVNVGNDLQCTGDIAGPVNAGGNVTCGDIKGNVDAGGSIQCDNVDGNADAGGYIECGNLGGNADAGGYIECGDIGGNADAGGYIECGNIGGTADASVIQ